MPANVPFLAKFAKRPKEASGSKSSNEVQNKGTISTRVARETTDDR